MASSSPASWPAAELAPTACSAAGPSVSLPASLSLSLLLLPELLLELL